MSDNRDDNEEEQPPPARPSPRSGSRLQNIAQSAERETTRRESVAARLVKTLERREKALLEAQNQAAQAGRTSQPANFQGQYQAHESHQTLQPHSQHHYEPVQGHGQPVLSHGDSTSMQYHIGAAGSHAHYEGTRTSDQTYRQHGGTNTPNHPGHGNEQALVHPGGYTVDASRLRRHEATETSIVNLQTAIETTDARHQQTTDELLRRLTNLEHENESLRQLSQAQSLTLQTLHSNLGLIEDLMRRNEGGGNIGLQGQAVSASDGPVIAPAVQGRSHPQGQGIKSTSSLEPNVNLRQIPQHQSRPQLQPTNAPSHPNLYSSFSEYSETPNSPGPSHLVRNNQPKVTANQQFVRPRHPSQPDGPRGNENQTRLTNFEAFMRSDMGIDEFMAQRRGPRTRLVEAAPASGRGQQGNTGGNRHAAASRPAKRSHEAVAEGSNKRHKGDGFSEWLAQGSDYGLPSSDQVSDSSEIPSKGRYSRRATTARGNRQNKPPAPHGTPLQQGNPAVASTSRYKNPRRSGPTVTDPFPDGGIFHFKSRKGSLRDMWNEYNTGYTHPTQGWTNESIKSLNEKYGTSWRSGPDVKYTSNYCMRRANLNNHVEGLSQRLGMDVRDLLDDLDRHVGPRVEAALKILAQRGNPLTDMVTAEEHASQLAARVDERRRLHRVVRQMEEQGQEGDQDEDQGANDEEDNLEAEYESAEEE